MQNPSGMPSETVSRPLSKRPIPEDARRVFRGEIFDVYQWDQKLFDGTVATFEKVRRTDTVNVIPVTHDGMIVLSEQEQPGAPPFVGVLGGRLEDGEKPETAANRELIEEAGMRAGHLILWGSEQLLEKIDWAIYTFIAKDCEKIGNQNLDSGEKIKLIYVSFDEFINLVSQDNYRDLEIALRIFRILRDPEKLEETRRLFFS